MKLMALIENQNTRAAMLDSTATTVVPICILLASVYAGMAIAHPLLIRGEHAWIMSLNAGVSTFLITLTGLYWFKRKEHSGAHLVIAILSLIMLYNVFINTLVDPEPERFNFFVGYLFFVGILVLSAPVFYALLLCGLFCWLLIATNFEFSNLLIWSSVMFVATGISILINYQRRQMIVGAATQESQLRKHSQQLSDLLKADELGLADSAGMFKKLADASFEELDVHRFGIWLFNKDETLLECQFFDSRSSEDRDQGPTCQQVEMPAYFHALQENRVISAVDAISDSRIYEQEDYLREKNIVSVLDGPIVVRGEVVGVVCNESVRVRKQWAIDDQIFAASIADIAALVIQAKERAELERRTLQAERLESLGILAGGVAHDFNNILTVVLGHTEMLEHMFSDNDEAMRSIISISKASENAKDLASHMLNYSGRGTFLTHVANLGDIVKGFYAGSGAEFINSGLLDVEVSEELFPVKLESSKIHQVLLNLIINAKDSGAKKIRLRTGKIAGLLLPMRSLVITEKLSAAQYAWLDVTDDGSGISEETLGKMFEPFFTTREFGSGFGLANVLGILRAHSGSIQAESEVGVGTSIRVFLPMDESETQPTLVAEGPANILPHATYRVLLVEDEKGVREITGRLLEDRGHTVTSFDSYTEVRARLVDTPLGEIDIALVDLSLGDGDGVQVITLLRAIKPDLPVVLMSGYDAGDSLSRLDQDVKVSFLQKPFAAQELMQSLSDACE